MIFFLLRVLLDCILDVVSVGKIERSGAELCLLDPVDHLAGVRVEELTH